MKLSLPCLCMIAILLGAGSSVEAFQFNFTPTISVSEQYTDNLFLDDDDTEYEFITLVSPGFLLEALGKHRGMELSYNPAYSIYSRFSEFNTFRYGGLSVRAWNDFSKYTTLELRENFVRTEDPQGEGRESREREADDQADETRDDTVRTGRQDYYRNSFRMDLNHQFGSEDYVNLAYAYSILRNDDPDIEDNDRHTPSLSLSYWFTPQLGLDSTFAYTYGDFDTFDEEIWSADLYLLKRITRHFEGFIQYDQTIVDNQDSDEEDYSVYAPLVGVRYRPTENTFMSLGLGYYFRDLDESGNDSGPLVNADITQEWVFRRGTISLIASSGYQQTTGGAENLGFEIFYSGGATADYRITKSLSGDIGGYVRYSDFKDTTPERTDVTTRAEVGLTYTPLRFLSTRLSYAYNSVSSDGSREDYKENSALLTVTLTPSQPLLRLR